MALGAGVASAVNLLDVEAVIIGGGIGCRLGDAVREADPKEMEKHLFNDDRPPVVEVASLGDLGGAIGAALVSAESEPKPRPRPRRASAASKKAS